MKHTFYECDPCDDPGRCQWCEGGLAWCTTCDLAEGELTTDCCGRKATRGEAERIYKHGTLDFRAGQWVNPACDDLFGLPPSLWRRARYPSAYRDE